MTARLINIALLITSLLCYLEWGGGNSGFLFQLELELFKTDDIAHTFTHVMVLAPLAGQFILLITVFQKTPGRRLTAIGIGLLSVLVLMISLVGILDLNYKIFGSTLPFLASVYFFFRNRKLYR
jgi:hypothetical protein